jgi:hypothetical protein
MPIAGLVDLIANANGKFIEPVKRNNARLRLTTGNLLKILQDQFNEDSGYLTTVSKALSGDVYPLAVSFTPPAITTSTRPTIALNNLSLNSGYTLSSWANRPSGSMLQILLDDTPGASRFPRTERPSTPTQPKIPCSPTFRPNTAIR